MKIRIKFRKQGPMKFIGHLDMMRYFQKVMRRADVDIRYSEGFSPHQIMSFASPLGVGLLSNSEYVDIEVHSTLDSKTMTERINRANVEGVEVTSYRLLPDSAKNAMSMVAASDYTVWQKDCGQTEEDFWNRFKEFCTQESIPIVKKTKKGEKEMDLKPYIYEIRTTSVLPADCPEGDVSAGDARRGRTGVFLKLSAGSSVNIKPELLLAAFYESLGLEYPQYAFQIQREELYGENDGRLVPLEEYGEDIE